MHVHSVESLARDFGVGVSFGTNHHLLGKLYINKNSTQLIQKVPYNSLFVACQNGPMTSIHTEIILSS